MHRVRSQGNASLEALCLCLLWPLDAIANQRDVALDCLGRLFGQGAAVFLQGAFSNCQVLQSYDGKEALV